MEGEEELQDLERFTFWSWFQSLLREQHNETTVNINLFSKKTCFKIDPTDNAKYTVKPFRSKWENKLMDGERAIINHLFFFFPVEFDIYLFLVFFFGALLFVFADSLSRYLLRKTLHFLI